MAIQKIEAYRCTYCGKVMLNPEMHEFECRYEPKARTCTTCGFENELATCTRCDELFNANDIEGGFCSNCANNIEKQ